MPQVQIIEMTEKEVPQVAAIEAEIFSCPWSQKGFSDTLYYDNVKFFLAVNAGRVIGYCGLYMAADEGEITNVAVKPEFRRRHIADTVLKAAISEGKRYGLRHFYLEVRVSNDAAIHLYEKHGFIRRGIRRGFYNMPKEDAYVMCKDIPDIIS